MSTSSVSIQLPDVNVLLALNDLTHPHHEAAIAWFADASTYGWATCPLTENGFVRIMATPAYPGSRLSPIDAIALLETLTQTPARMHHFWADSISLRDRTLFHPAAITGHRHITDVYLLGLCQHKGGTLVTLDTGITASAIVSPHPELIRLLTL